MTMTTRLRSVLSGSSKKASGLTGAGEGDGYWACHNSNTVLSRRGMRRNRPTDSMMLLDKGDDCISPSLDLNEQQQGIASHY